MSIHAYHLNAGHIFATIYIARSAGRLGHEHFEHCTPLEHSRFHEANDALFPHILKWEFKGGKECKTSYEIFSFSRKAVWRKYVLYERR